MATLQDFIAEVRKNGLMRTARYTVLLPGASIDSRMVALYCDQVQLPGMNYSTTPHTTYGEVREIPYGRLFDTVTLSFYVDNEMAVKKYFDAWLYKVQNPINRTFNYYNDYIKSITIMVEDLSSEEKYSVELHECYPKTVGSIQLDYASKDLMKLSVTLAYKYWEPKNAYGIQNMDYLNYNPGALPEYNNIYTGVTNTGLSGVSNSAKLKFADTLNSI